MYIESLKNTTSVQYRT